MEFKEFGPLEQSKQSAENKKKGWASIILLIGLGAIALMLYNNNITRQYRKNEY